MGKRKSIQACNNILTETDLQNAAKIEEAMLCNKMALSSRG
jgi:hypothetical protein